MSLRPDSKIPRVDKDNLVAPGDKELLLTADTPAEVCELVLRASEEQKALA